MSTEVIVALVATGVALLGVAVGAFFSLLNVIRTESRGLRAELREEISGLRQEMHEDNARLRQEMREDNARLRQEMREDNARLRQELLTEIREGNQRILEALYYHRHDPATGTATFHPPPQAAAD